MSAHIHPYIDSVKHDALKKIRDFQQRKHRNDLYYAVIDGCKELEWALEHKAEIDTLIATEATSESAAVLECERRKVGIFVARDSIFKRYFMSSDQDAIAALVKMERINLSHVKNLVLFLENIIDPGNLGSIIRSARSFGIDHFFANNKDVDWFSKKAIKAARGTHFVSKFHAFSNVEDGIKALKSRGYQIIATSPHAPSLISLSKLQKKPLALLIGNEQNGLTESALNNADVVVRIPMMHGVESLNVAVAAGISIYELYFRLVLTMLSKNIENNIGRNFGILFQLFPQVLNRDLSLSTTLNANQVIFLMVLKLDGTMTEKQAEEDLMRLGEDPALAMKILLKDGLMEKEASTDTFRITHKGEHDLAKLWMVIENSEAKIMSVLSDQEQSELRSMLARLEHKCVDLLK